MSNQRPKNLNLFSIRFPIPAIVSILHRISGFILFLLVPAVIYVFSLSVSSQAGFQVIHDYLAIPTIKFLVWAFLAAFIYHLLAGIRHLLADINIGIELKGSRYHLSAKAVATLVIFLSVLFIIGAGIYLW